MPHDRYESYHSIHLSFLTNTTLYWMFMVIRLFEQYHNQLHMNDIVLKCFSISYESF